ncbi:MAG: hypothetical protein J0M02_09275 [Planctomycetes bacterium]|nr:hypothetical protein [Planctomycetota bacterium]
MRPFPAILPLLCSASCLASFEVTRNVNDGRPPLEKVVLFAKDRPHDHLVLSNTGTGELTYAPDGAIVATISGSGVAAPRIAWRAGDGRPASFALDAYTYLILVCRLEGVVRETDAKGKVSEKRPDNLWFGVDLYNAAGERIGVVNLADVNEARPGATPAETTVLRIPMVLFRGAPVADAMAAQLGTNWQATKPNQSRAFRWVIDRIALAD